MEAGTGLWVDMDKVKIVEAAENHVRFYMKKNRSHSPAVVVRCADKESAENLAKRAATGEGCRFQESSASSPLPMEFPQAPNRTRMSLKDKVESIVRRHKPTDAAHCDCAGEVLGTLKEVPQTCMLATTRIGCYGELCEIRDELHSKLEEQAPEWIVHLVVYEGPGTRAHLRIEATRRDGECPSE